MFSIKGIGYKQGQNNCIQEKRRIFLHHKINNVQRIATHNAVMFDVTRQHVIFCTHDIIFLHFVRYIIKQIQNAVQGQST